VIECLPNKCEAPVPPKSKTPSPPNNNKKIKSNPEWQEELPGWKMRTLNVWNLISLKTAITPPGV
jgi:hypothetical protein